MVAIIFIWNHLKCSNKCDDDEEDANEENDDFDKHAQDLSITAPLSDCDLELMMMNINYDAGEPISTQNSTQVSESTVTLTDGTRCVCGCLEKLIFLKNINHFFFQVLSTRHRSA